MKLSDLFKVSLVAAAVSLAGCGGDLVVKEGDTTVNEGDNISIIGDGGVSMTCRGYAACPSCSSRC